MEQSTKEKHARNLALYLGKRCWSEYVHSDGRTTTHTFDLKYDDLAEFVADEWYQCLKVYATPLSEMTVDHLLKVAEAATGITGWERGIHDRIVRKNLFCYKITVLDEERGPDILYGCIQFRILDTGEVSICVIDVEQPPEDILHPKCVRVKPEYLTVYRELGYAPDSAFAEGWAIRTD